MKSVHLVGRSAHHGPSISLLPTQCGDVKKQLGTADFRDIPAVARSLPMFHHRSTVAGTLLLVLVACGGEMEGGPASQGSGGMPTAAGGNPSGGGVPMAAGGSLFGGAPTAAGGSTSGGVSVTTSGGSATTRTTYSGGGTTGQSTLQYHGGSGGFICDFNGESFVGGRTLVNLAVCASCFCAYSGRFICWGNDCSPCSFGGKEYAPGESFSPDACTRCTCSSSGTLNCTPLSVLC